MDSMTDEASSSLLTGFQDTHSVSDASCASLGHLQAPLTVLDVLLLHVGCRFSLRFPSPLAAAAQGATVERAEQRN